jgi:YVTN family beta-propeller protein
MHIMAGRYVMTAVAILAGFTMGNKLVAQQTTPRVYIANSFGDDLSVIDINTSRVITKIKLGQHAGDVCAPDDGRSVFASEVSGDNNFLDVIDTATNTVVNKIALTGRPAECASTPDGHYVVAPVSDGGGLLICEVKPGASIPTETGTHDSGSLNITSWSRFQNPCLGPGGSVTEYGTLFGPGAVDIIDMTQKKIVKVLPLNGPHDCFESAGNNDALYCEARVDHSMRRINLKTLDYDLDVHVTGDPLPFGVSKDGSRIYTAMMNLHGMEVVDTQSGITRRVVLPPMPLMSSSPCAKLEPTPVHALGINPDSSEVWLGSMTDSRVYVYDTASDKILTDPIPVGECPRWISFSADGKYAAVSDGLPEDVTIVDAKAHKPIATVPSGGKEPMRMVVVNVPAS